MPWTKPWKKVTSNVISIKQDKNGQERKQTSGNPGMHRAQGHRNAGNLPLYNHKKQEEYTGEAGDEEIQPHPEKIYDTQGNKIMCHGKEIGCNITDRSR